MAKRQVPANSRPLAALALLGALCACATTPAAPRPEAPPAGWHIVERIGVARYLPPGAATWMPATIGETLADGSEVSTGRGGRLIVDAPRSHISVGPGSRFVLPDGDTDDRLNQQAGWLRYRVAQAAQPFRIYTRSLELEVRAGVVDVQVDQLATDVTVQEGQVRVATPDGLRQTQMMAGQSARAGGSDDVQLAVRMAPGAALQPVDPVILPALQPAATTPAIPAMSPPVAPAPDAPAASPTAALAAPGSTGTAIRQPPPAGPVPQAPLVLRQPAAPHEARPQAAGAGATQSTELLPAKMRAADQVPDAEVIPGARDEADQPGAPERQTPLGERRTPENQAAALRRAQFERLTAGMLDQVETHHPVPAPTVGVVR